MINVKNGRHRVLDNLIYLKIFMKIKLLKENIKIPTQAYENDAGIDIYSPEDIWIWPGETKQIKLGIAIQIEENEVAVMSERSGQAINQGLTSIGNIIDAGYRGEISIILSNIKTLGPSDDNKVHIKIGDKIGQIIILKLGNRKIEIVKELSETERGINAHFSSDNKNKKIEIKQYNTTQLNPEQCFERHIFHRDQFAHYLRWTHVLNIAKIGMNILDVGCGSGNLYEVFYRNKYSPNKFVGIDIRTQIIEKNKIKFPKAIWINSDPVIEELPKEKWDIITSFEVLEHLGKNNGDMYLKNISSIMDKNTTLLISTPCYDEQVGAAENHIINGNVGEYTYQELKELLEKYFIIEDVFGTFASQKDYKLLMNDWQLKMYEHLKKYYDSNLVSNLMAPFFPEQSRNCLWKLKIK